ncbi:MAG TPA: hypothetical protein VFS50_09960 [Meiothermus sp.]|nr:hypothetical protein [Meiothermus sp.]
MNLKDLLLEGPLVFILAFGVLATLTYLWSRLMYAAGELVRRIGPPR